MNLSIQWHRHMPACAVAVLVVCVRISCQLEGDGCMLETYLEFEVCPSHWSPLTPCLTPVQVSRSKNKEAHVLDAHRRRNKGVRYHASRVFISACKYKGKQYTASCWITRKLYSGPRFPWSSSLINMLPASKLMPVLSSIIILSAFIKGHFYSAASRITEKNRPQVAATCFGWTWSPWQCV